MGKFIVFEGSDGSGKTTRVEKIVKRLNLHGYKSEFTKEPQNTIPGSKVIKGKDTFNYSLEDRELHQEALIRGKEENQFLFCDRYALSGAVYHSYNSEVCYERYKSQRDLFLQPDLTIFVNTPLEECKSRILDRKVTVAYDLENIEAFRNMYLHTLWKSVENKVDEKIFIIKGENLEEDLQNIFSYLINTFLK